MGIVNKLMEKLGYTKSVGPLVDDARIMRSLREILGSGMSGGSLSRPYSQSVWVYACVNTIAEEIGRVPFVLKVDKGPLEPDAVERGAMYELFQNPNPLMTQEELIKATMIYYSLNGEAFWILDGRTEDYQIPTEIYTFDPGRFEPVCHPKTGMVVGWMYKGKEETFFNVNEIIHFKMFNPYNDIRGLSPLEAARLSIEQNYYAANYNRQFFESGAVTSMGISVPEELSDDAYNRMLKQFEDRHKGANKAHRIVIAEGGAKITESKIGQREMDFIQGQELTAKEIMAIFKVNEVVLGNYNDIKSYEGIKSAHKAFWEECLIPKITYFESVLWSKFFSKIGQRRGKGKVWGSFDLSMVGPLQVNYAEKVDTAHRLWTMGWPINMINKRLELGMVEVDWGDEWWVPGGFMPVTALMGMPPQANNPNQDKNPTDDENPPDSTDAANASLTGSQTRMIEFNDVKCLLAKEFKEKLKRFLFESRKDVLEALFMGKRLEIGEKDYARLKKDLSEVYALAINKGQAVGKQELGESATEGTQEEIDAYIKTKTNFVVSNFKGLICNLMDSLDKLETNKAEKDFVADKVREVFNFLTNKSSELSKNEAEAAFAFGQNLSTKGVVDELKKSLKL